MIQTAAGLLGSAIQRQKNTETLRVNVQDLNRLLYNFPGVVQRFDRNLRCTYVNPVVEELLGISPSKFIGKTDREMGYPEELVEKWEEYLKEVLETVNPNWVEYQMPALHGIAHRETRLTPEFIDDGTVGSVLVISLDVTARRQAEESFRTLVENSLQELVIFQDEHIVYANPAALQNNSMSLSDLQRMHVQEMLCFIHPDDRSIFSELTEKKPAAGEPVRCTYRAFLPDGRLRWLDVLISRIEYQGKPAFQAAQVDITGLKKAEELLQQPCMTFKLTLRRSRLPYGWVSFYPEG